MRPDEEFILRMAILGFAIGALLMGYWLLALAVAVLVVVL